MFNGNFFFILIFFITAYWFFFVLIWKKKVHAVLNAPKLIWGIILACNLKWIDHFVPFLFYFIKLFIMICVSIFCKFKLNTLNDMGFILLKSCSIDEMTLIIMKIKKKHYTFLNGRSPTYKKSKGWIRFSEICEV